MARGRTSGPCPHGRTLRGQVLREQGVIDAVASLAAREQPVAPEFFDGGAYLGNGGPGARDGGQCLQRGLAQRGLALRDDRRRRPCGIVVKTAIAVAAAIRDKGWRQGMLPACVAVRAPRFAPWLV